MKTRLRLSPGVCWGRMVVTKVGGNMELEDKAMAFRISLIYRADGMTRPLSFRQVVGGKSVTEALRFVVSFIGSAYESGFEVLTWSAENLDKPVELRYVVKPE